MFSQKQVDRPVSLQPERDPNEYRYDPSAARQRQKLYKIKNAFDPAARKIRHGDPPLLDPEAGTPASTSQSSTTPAVVTTDVVGAESGDEPEVAQDPGVLKNLYNAFITLTAYIRGE